MTQGTTDVCCMKKSEINNSADLFFYKGKIDFNAAVLLFESFSANKREIDIDTIMFHFQQCAEKLLKSLLSKNKIRIKQTHSIESLIERLSENSIDVPDDGLDPLKNLSEYAVDGRYSIIHDDIDDAERYIGLLKELLMFVQAEISE